MLYCTMESKSRPQNIPWSELVSSPNHTERRTKDFYWLSPAWDPSKPRKSHLTETVSLPGQESHPAPHFSSGSSLCLPAFCSFSCKHPWEFLAISWYLLGPCLCSKSRLSVRLCSATLRKISQAFSTYTYLPLQMLLLFFSSALIANFTGVLLSFTFCLCH